MLSAFISPNEPDQPHRNPSLKSASNIDIKYQLFINTQIQKYTNTEILKRTISLFQPLSHPKSPTNLDSIAASLFVLNWLSWQIVTITQSCGKALIGWPQIHKYTNTKLHLLYFKSNGPQQSHVGVQRWHFQLQPSVFMDLETMVADLRGDNLWTKRSQSGVSKDNSTNVRLARFCNSLTTTADLSGDKNIEPPNTR